ncbi:glycogen debranching protein GlgX [Microcoleus sp. FACHB-1515]|uniref:glycogen debranching protein GlgX n=1 Tax=Cyanophyceae TaxID=3028117 RepID=UPI0016849071|nr:glycogen debranching protein GlgX [Microcoleus sp. FACHB-1515]MBD2092603.1 glycogen debranching protein GlgX [Microcoleus sp. FACHB-1515]
MGSEVLPGLSFPLGATVQAGGVNFCLYSKYATAIDLLLFDQSSDPKPNRVIHLTPKPHRTHHYWHVFVPGLAAGQVYAYRAHGLFAPDRGLRFDAEKVLIDPYARAIVNTENYDRRAASRPGDNCAQALRGVVVDPNSYDWEGDLPLCKPYAKTVVYEMHVGGFTRNPNSGVESEKRGTFAGLIEKIPHLKELGVTAVELLPIHQFDEQDVRPGLKNVWGYSTIAFFAPHSAYSSRRDPLGAVDEFRDMVKALHKAGIEVILDVVFNHTAEGDQQGPTLSFRGLANSSYYILDSENPAFYSNYSGCGNSVKANHAVVARMILDCLQYWVAEMHVDGFRFDLASALARGGTGALLEEPPILWSIDSNPILVNAKMIAEAWDAAGLYQVGSFAGDRFAEWNGPFRDEVRRFVRGDRGMVRNLAFRLLGSPDIYPQPDREPNHSINFVTCHDGFTLNDLVSYDRKHNQANREGNRDGSNDNHSWNCGVEGATTDPKIEALRLRQIKNLFTITLVSQGTPMLLMGDEVRRSQGGNNNAYCQDQLNWFDWNAVEQQGDLLRFVKRLIHFTQSLEILQQERILEVTFGSQDPYLVWHGVRLGKPDWSEHSHSLALTLHHPEAGEHLHIILNAYWEPLKFELPPLDRAEAWYRVVDTSLPSPNDFADEPPIIKSPTYAAEARSSVILMVRSK